MFVNKVKLKLIGKLHSCVAKFAINHIIGSSKVLVIPQICLQKFWTKFGGAQTNKVLLTLSYISPVKLLVRFICRELSWCKNNYYY